MRRFVDEPPVEERVGERLRERGESLAVAESVTGGLLGALLTAVPGSSAYFDRGWTVYAYDAWRAELGVSREMLDEHGAVSDGAVEELAARARDRADVTWGLATTGIAGPTGGKPETPVGTAFVGLAYAAPWESGDSFVRSERFEFDGDRQEVREKFARAALSMLLGELESS